MWRLIKKWWFLQRLEQIIILHTAKNSFQDVLFGRTVLLSEQFFILGNSDYPGIIFKPFGRFSWLLFWRNWKYEDLNKLMDLPKFKRKMHEYHRFFKYLKEKDYIVMEQTTEPGVIMPNVTYLADDVHGLAGLIQFMADTFKVPWGIIVIIITFLIGLSWKEILNYLVRIF